ncbi:MAG: hypothetical protein LBC19_00655 [Tannerella sp.]|jgi:hypothetical protein|nr:hypothetical protein [Tannerella sp.]
MRNVVPHYKVWVSPIPTEYRHREVRETGIFSVWPIPSYAINTNTGGIINQNIGYPGTEKNVEPLVYHGD